MAPCYKKKRPGRQGRPGFLFLSCGFLPEEVVDHVDHFAAVDIDQQRIVIVTHPAVGTVDIRQAILPGIVDPVPIAEEQVVEIEPDAQAAIAVIAIGRIVAAQVIGVAIGPPVVIPVIAVVIAPAAIPPAMVAPVVTAIIASVATIIAAVFAPGTVIPEAAITGVRTERAMAGKVLPGVRSDTGGGILVIRWTLPSAFRNRIQATPPLSKIWPTISSG